MTHRPSPQRWSAPADVHDGVQATSFLRAEVAASWARCRAAGIDPANIPLCRVADGELALRLEGNAELIAAARQQLDLISALLIATPHAVYITDRDGIVLLSTGNDPALLAGTGLEPGYDWSERRMGTNGAGTCLVTRRPEAIVGAEHYGHAFRTCTCTAAPIFNAAGEPIGALDVTTLAVDGGPERLMLAMHAARMIERDLEAARNAERGDALKRTATALLTSPEHPDEVLELLPRVLVPRLADWAVLYLPDAERAPAYRLAHRDQAGATLLEQLWSQYPARAAWQHHPVAEVLRTGAPVLAPQLTERDLAAVADLEVRAILEILGPRSYLAVPLKLRGRTHAALLLASRTPGRFGAHELALAEEVTALAVLAVERTAARAELRERVAAQQNAEAQVRFQAGLLDAVDQAVIATDLEGRIRYWSRFATELYGWTADEVLGRMITDVTTPAELDEHAGEIMAQLQRGDSWTGEFALRRKDGSTFLGEVTDSPIRDEAGRLVGIVGISRDVTTRSEAARDLREREQRLRELYAAAERAVREREEVVAIVGHDLRNPLNVIVMATSLLLEHELPEEKRASQLRIIRRATTQMTRLISDLLDLSRLRAGGLELSYAPVTPGHLVAEAASHLQPLIDAQGAQLVIDVPPALPEIEVDVQRIRQVLDNLVSNALRYTPAGESIRVSAEVAGEVVTFRIEDRGPGIPAEEQPYLFERYWRGRGRSGDGLGLGLAICKGIVDAHGGRIWAESQPGRGTRMCFELPRTRYRVAPARG